MPDSHAERDPDPFAYHNADTLGDTNTLGYANTIGYTNPDHSDALGYADCDTERDSDDDTLDHPNPEPVSDNYSNCRTYRYAYRHAGRYTQPDAGDLHPSGRGL